MEVRPGHRVQLTGTKCGGFTLPIGARGTVAAICNGYIGIVFDTPIVGGHELSGAEPNYPTFKTGHCRWGQEKDVTIIGEVDPPVPESYSKYPGWAKGGPFEIGMRPVQHDEEATDD